MKFSAARQQSSAAAGPPLFAQITTSLNFHGQQFT